jgi:hypothetical protein
MKTWNLKIGRLMLERLAAQRAENLAKKQWPRPNELRR